MALVVSILALLPFCVIIIDRNIDLSVMSFFFFFFTTSFSCILSVLFTVIDLSP